MELKGKGEAGGRRRKETEIHKIGVYKQNYFFADSVFQTPHVCAAP